MKKNEETATGVRATAMSRLRVTRVMKIWVEEQITPKKKVWEMRNREPAGIPSASSSEVSAAQGIEVNAE